MPEPKIHSNGKWIHDENFSVVGLAYLLEGESEEQRDARAKKFAAAETMIAALKDITALDHSGWCDGGWGLGLLCAPCIAKAALQKAGIE